MSRWVKLHDQILKWDWHDDPNTLSLFIHLLLLARFTSASVHGIKIRRGQYLTGRKKLAQITGLSEQNIRTSLKHLKSTKEVTIKTTRLYSIITVLNYDKYQNSNQDTNQRLTKSQPTPNQPLTTSLEGSKKDDRKKESIAPKKRLRFVPPSLDEITQFLKERSVTKIPPETFFNYYESIGWMVGKNKMKSWKAALSGWISRDEKAGTGQVKDEYTYEEIVAITNGTCSGYEIIPGKRTWRKVV